MAKYVLGYALAFGAFGALDSLLRTMNSTGGAPFNVDRVVTFLVIGAVGGAIVGRKRRATAPE